MKTISNKPSWVDNSLYPFDSKYLSLENGRMHYVDEGCGDVMLFIHGTPTWSFLYRDFIKELSKDYRCIAIDHLGFGMSEKSDTSPGTPEWHSKNVSGFIKALDLHDITLVVHDFGGPIGLAAGIENPKRIKRIVLFNSWLWSTAQEKASQKIDSLINSWFGKFLYLTMNFSPKVLLKQGFENKKHLSKKVHSQYIKPFPCKRSRVTLLNLAKALVGSSGWYQQQWEQLDRLSEKKWLILWGAKDNFITMKHLNKWEARLPLAKTITFECGHFIQEEKTFEAIQAIDHFMKS